jgi:uncharacterized membrane protein
MVPADGSYERMKNMRTVCLILLMLAAALLFSCSSESIDKPAPGAIGTCSPDKTYANYTPASGCYCADKWSYNGVTYCGGICASPDGDNPWCYTTVTCAGKTWSYCSYKS